MYGRRIILVRIKVCFSFHCLGLVTTDSYGIPCQLRESVAPKLCGMTCPDLGGMAGVIRPDLSALKVTCNGDKASQENVIICAAGCPSPGLPAPTELLSECCRCDRKQNSCAAEAQ